MGTTDLAPRRVFVQEVMRYCEPYMQWQHCTFYSSAALGLKLPAALAQTWSGGEYSVALSESGWTAACNSGRVLLRRQERGAAFFAATPAEAVRPGDRCKVLNACIRRHVYAHFYAHVYAQVLVEVCERPITATLPQVLASSERYVVVNKPAGLPVTFQQFERHCIGRGAVPCCEGCSAQC